MVATTQNVRWLAHQYFEQALQRGRWRKIIGWLFQRRVTLLGLDEVRRNVRISNAIDRGLGEISLDAIGGSVNRTRDFTTSFLPLKYHLLERWTNIMVAMERMEPLPPIEVYKLGDQYYIIDGHHRVSVAKWLGIKELTAHVIEIQTEGVAQAQSVRPQVQSCWQTAGC